MDNELMKTETNQPAVFAEAERETAARVLLLGGVARALPPMNGDFGAEASSRDQFAAALHADDAAAAASLAEAGADVVSLAGMRGDRLGAVRQSLKNVRSIGAGDTEALAYAPAVICVNDVRLGFLACGECPAGGFDARADLLHLRLFDHVRMLLSQCDHVIVLVRAGLEGMRLPLPEWRARYRALIDAGASVVADTGLAKGWESYQNGLAFYGLGQPDGGDALAVLLSLKQNGKLDYEVRALENAEGALRFSSNEAFKRTIDEQNRLFLDEEAYLRAVNELCRAYYCEQERTKKQGFFQSLLSGAGGSAQEERLRSLLKDESRRLAILRALAGMEKEAQKERS